MSIELRDRLVLGQRSWEGYQNISAALKDNDPKHTAKTKQEWLQDKSLNVFEWPRQSPDLNPIEHLWRVLRIALPYFSPSNLTVLERICREE